MTREILVVEKRSHGEEMWGREETRGTPITIILTQDKYN